MQQALQKFLNEVVTIISDLKPSIYIYGSYPLNDFKDGWSDIDFICFTKGPLSEIQTMKLLKLKSLLKSTNIGNPYYEVLEGAFVPLDSFLNHTPDVIVYYGTSGEKSKDIHNLNSFDILEILDNSQHLFGEDIRDKLPRPTKSQMASDVFKHIDNIREYTNNMSSSVYTINWFLDISRCIYTLREGKIISKTDAGKYAIKNKLCPDPDVLKRIVEIRENPSKYLHDDEVLRWILTLKDELLRYVEVLVEVAEQEKNF